MGSMRPGVKLPSPELKAESLGTSAAAERRSAHFVHFAGRFPERKATPRVLF